MRVPTQELLYRRRLGRRRLLGLAGGTMAATMIGPWGATGVSTARALSSLNPKAGFGPLIPDPNGRLALPQGFQYVELSPDGGKLSNGESVPGWHDGMAAFPGPRGTTVLVRNHEIAQENKDNAAIHPVIGKSPYSTDVFGGTTAIIVDTDRSELQSFVTTAGTVSNCAGVATP